MCCTQAVVLVGAIRTIRGGWKDRQSIAAVRVADGTRVPGSRRPGGEERADSRSTKRRITPSRRFVRLASSGRSACSTPQGLTCAAKRTGRGGTGSRTGCGSPASDRVIWSSRCRCGRFASCAAAWPAATGTSSSTGPRNCRGVKPGMGAAAGGGRAGGLARATAPHDGTYGSPVASDWRSSGHLRRTLNGLKARWRWSRFLPAIATR